MELPFLASLLLFVLLLSWLSIVLKRELITTVTSSELKKKSISQLLPGPSKLPIIGNLHQLLGSLPHHSLAKLAKKHGPLMHLQLGELPTLVISSPELAKEIMKTHDIDFAQRPFLLTPTIISYNCTNIVFSPYGPYWRQLRKICTMELLSPKRVQSFRSVREEEVSNLIKSILLQANSPINLSEMIFSSTYGITSRAAFGKNYKYQDRFMSMIMEVTKLAGTGGYNIADMYPSIKLFQWISGMRSKLEEQHKRADRVLEMIIHDHRTRAIDKVGDGDREEDLVDVLLRVQQNGDLEVPLSDDNIKAVILDIFGAGSETSAVTVEWVISELLKNPILMNKAQAEVRDVFKKQGNVDEARIHELKFLKSIIKETLRLHTPVPLIPRECCTNNVEIDGYHIPMKTRVLINIWAIGLDPKYWTEPERFHPERFLNSRIDYKGADFEFIPFGSGRRICPGIAHGIANVELPLAQLLFHFDWELPHGMNYEDLDMTESYGLTVRRKNDLLLIPIPREL